MWALAVTNDTYDNVLFSPKTWCFLFIWYYSGFGFFLWEEKRTFHRTIYWEKQKGDTGLLGKNEKKEKCFLSSQDLPYEWGKHRNRPQKFAALWSRLWSRLIEGDPKICSQNSGFHFGTQSCQPHTSILSNITTANLTTHTNWCFTAPFSSVLFLSHTYSSVPELLLAGKS